jgi:hypothetical protein
MGNWFLAVFTFIVAFPFGFWRAKSKFRSREWMLAVHIPVVFIVAARLINKFYYDIGFSWESLLMNLVSFFLAQYIAGLIYRYFIRKN